MNKIAITLFITFLCTQIVHAQNVAVNATGAAPDPSALFDVQSTNKGMLIPRMSTAQRKAIATPATGLMVFDNTTNTFWFKNPTGWVELVDSSNTVWSKRDTSVYLNHNENVGIGTNTPTVRLEVDHGTDATAFNGGYLQLGASSNQNLAFDNNEMQARNNGHPADVYMQVGGGNVGIGTGNADVKLQINNGTDVSASSGGYLQLGSGNLPNIGLDNNEMQARNNGSASTLYLQHNGGDLEVGAASHASSLNLVNGKLITPKTGSDNNLLPLCYGKVSNGGALLSYTDNVGLYRADGTGGERYYEVSCPGINVSTVMTVTPNQIYGIVQISAVAVFHSPGVARIYIVSGLSEQVYADFSFIFYNR